MKYTSSRIKNHEQFKLSQKHFLRSKGSGGEVSGGEVVTSPSLDQPVECLIPTMSHARFLRVSQHYPTQKKTSIFLFSRLES